MRTLFNNYVQNRFFNKLLLLYSIIIVVTIGVLVYIVVTSITGLLREQAITYNKQVLQLVSDHFHKQNHNLKKVMNDLYKANGLDRTSTIYDAFAALENSYTAKTGNAAPSGGTGGTAQTSSGDAAGSGAGSGGSLGDAAGAGSGVHPGSAAGSGGSSPYKPEAELQRPAGLAGGSATVELREHAAFINRFMMDTALPSDTHIMQMIMTNRSFDYEINSTRYTSNIKLGNYIHEIQRYIESRDKSNINGKPTYLLPTMPISNEGSSINLYGIYDYIRPPSNPSEYTGYMIFTFNTESFQRAYEQFEKYLIGTLLVLSENGEVIYDSSGQYYGAPFPYWEQVQQPSDNIRIAGESSIVNINKDENYGFTTIGIIPLSELHMGINSINRMVITAGFICILITIVLTILSTTRFSRRLKGVLQIIREIQKGNLSVRPLNDKHDEVGIIAHNLYLMSGKLDDYIKREYVLELRRKDSELKQKTAELYALQSQINPHFLYNTLEAIRMRALSSRDTETGKMIKILAKLFRSSIKDEMIITLEEEMNYCQSLLELYFIRFQGRLEVVFEVEDSMLHYGVFRHMLQPIIENSIAHGIDLTRDDNVITVRGRQEDGQLIITVSDNGQGMEQDMLAAINKQLEEPRLYAAGSIGLLNVESRIKLIFGPHCGLHIKSNKGGGTSVMVTVLAKTKEELQSNVQGTDRG